MAKDDQSKREQVLFNRRFKRAILDVMFTECETFYLHCMPNPLLQIGKRGLVDKEKTEGIILAFGPYSNRHLSWDESFLFCEMQFGGWEQVIIPYEAIARIFDKGGQVLMHWETHIAPDVNEEGAKLESASTMGKSAKKSKTEKEPAAEGDSEKSKVIEVDFGRKKK